MKAILQFNLPEERTEFEIATSAVKYMSALFEIKNTIKNFSRHGISINGKECSSDAEVNLTHFICDKIFEIIPDDDNL